jgi:prophage DNA circulation protein
MASPITPFPDSQINQLALSSGGATTILQLQSGIAWRSSLRRASFRGARFHVDTGVRESGRRIVNHEFPKREVPYAEDMGRKAREFTVRGYIIVYPRDTGDLLQQKNYIPARDALILALEEDGPANLQLPTLGILNVACQRYRITEEEKFGGYCVFDMTFTEFGQAPATGTRDSAAGITYAAQSLGDATQTGITSGIKAIDSGAATSTSGTVAP